MHYRPIVDYNPVRAKFMVALEDGSHAVFTLKSYAPIKKGMGVEGMLAKRGPITLTLDNRQHFEAFGDTGPTNSGTCRQLVWPA